MIFIETLTVLCLYVTQISGANQYKYYSNFKYYNVQGSEDGIKNLKNLIKEDGDTIFYMGTRSAAEVVVAPELNMKFREIVSKQDLNATLLHNDISKLFRSEKPSPLRKRRGITWDAYYDVNDIHKFLQNMSNLFPTMTEFITGGKSFEGRTLAGIRINTPTRHGETKPVFFIESGIHAREWIAPATTTYFINQLLTSSDPNVTRLRDQFDWRIFPVVNPDGYHYTHTFDRMWRKTRSVSTFGYGCVGADPNRNWDYN